MCHETLHFLSVSTKVWDKTKPAMSDYVNIPVGYAISPAQATVTLGSVVCFSSPILTETGGSPDQYLDVGLVVGGGSEIGDRVRVDDSCSKMSDNLVSLVFFWLKNVFKDKWYNVTWE